MQNETKLSRSIAILEKEKENLDYCLGELIATILVNVENGRITGRTKELVEYVNGIQKRIERKKYCDSMAECTYSDCPTAFCDL